MGLLPIPAPKLTQGASRAGIVCISYANVHNYYSPYAYCSLNNSVACAQHIQLPTHTCAGHMC